MYRKNEWDYSHLTTATALITILFSSQLTKIRWALNQGYISLTHCIADTQKRYLMDIADIDNKLIFESLYTNLLHCLAPESYYLQH